MSPLTRDSRVFLIFSELLEKKVIQEVSVGLSKASGSFKPNSIYSFSDAMDKSRSVLDFPALDIALYLTTTEFPRFKQVRCGSLHVCHTCVTHHVSPSPLGLDLIPRV